MMEIPIRLNVTGQWIKTGGIVLVSSSVNIYSCSFVFSDDWNGYTKTAVFCLNDGTNFEIPILQDACNIPWEALQEPGNLRIGVYGIMGSCENGQRYPTVWTNDIRVARGTPSCETNPPTPSAYEQFVQQVEDASNQAVEAAQEAKDAAASIKQYKVGHGLKLEDDGETLSVNAVDNFDGDNTLPITAGAVQASIGTIEVVLSKI